MKLKENPNPRISITGVMIQDSKNKGWTAYFAEFPEVIAEGDTEEEAQKNLFEALQIVFETKKSEAETERGVRNKVKPKTIKVESFELQAVAV